MYPQIHSASHPSELGPNSSTKLPQADPCADNSYKKNSGAPDSAPSRSLLATISTFARAQDWWGIGRGLATVAWAISVFIFLVTASPEALTMAFCGFVMCALLVLILPNKCQDPEL